MKRVMQRSRENNKSAGQRTQKSTAVSSRRFSLSGKSTGQLEDTLLRSDLPQIPQDMRKDKAKMARMTHRENTKDYLFYP